jgi:hypothetical protein
MHVSGKVEVLIKVGGIRIEVIQKRKEAFSMMVLIMIACIFIAWSMLNFKEVLGRT